MHFGWDFCQWPRTRLLWAKGDKKCSGAVECACFVTTPFGLTGNPFQNISYLEFSDWDLVDTIKLGFV